MGMASLFAGALFRASPSPRSAAEFLFPERGWGHASQEGRMNEAGTMNWLGAADGWHFEGAGQGVGEEGDAFGFGGFSDLL